MTNTLLEERRQFIEKKLLAEGKIRVAELSKLFNVSSETIRKDILYLEEKGIAKKGYGGAVVVNELLEPSFLEKHKKFQEEKTKIAKSALDYIADGMIVLLDAGSTVYTIAKMLALKKNLTVFTNSPKSAQVLDDYKIKTYLLGGEIRNNSNALVGGWAVRALSEINADIAVLGTSGFNGRQGPCVENFEEAEIKKAMISSANKIIILGDSSKAKTHSMIEFAKWEVADAFITDDNIDSDTLKNIKEKTQVITV
jgi:DeoR family transcriptional regulator, fructose operon transcriptional repressor